MIVTRTNWDHCNNGGRGGSPFDGTGLLVLIAGEAFVPVVIENGVLVVSTTISPMTRIGATVTTLRVGLDIPITEDDTSRVVVGLATAPSVVPLFVWL